MCNNRITRINQIVGRLLAGSVKNITYICCLNAKKIEFNKISIKPIRITEKYISLEENDKAKHYLKGQI